jgi:undecaprenyl-diphosphatase
MPGAIEWWQGVLLAMVQGLTEFLPISSSAHLIIPSLVLGWPDQGLAFDVAVHVGTLSAVILFFRRDLAGYAADSFSTLRTGRLNPGSREVCLLALASLPVAAVGLAAGDLVEGSLRALPVIATTTLVFGLLLGLADRHADNRSARALTVPLALGIGLAQAIAPVPGVSRSGITITAGLFLGLSRHDAARFSFLLSIPTIGGAGLLKALDLIASPEPAPWLSLLTVAVLAGITAYLCIAAFLALIERVGMRPFVWYRILLALALYGLWFFR